MNTKTPKAIRTYRFRVEISRSLPGSDILGKVYFVETSATTRKEARDKVSWLAAPESIEKITFCDIVAT